MKKKKKQGDIQPWEKLEKEMSEKEYNKKPSEEEIDALIKQLAEILGDIVLKEHGSWKDELGLPF
jgi:hypothetical protein